MDPMSRASPEPTTRVSGAYLRPIGG